jgi:hypothetical protein
MGRYTNLGWWKLSEEYFYFIESTSAKLYRRKDRIYHGDFDVKAREFQVVENTVYIDMGECVDFL